MSIQKSELTTVAIVGRPNVGKSRLFNFLTDTRKAVVKNEPGVTRDLNFCEAELWGKNFTVVDTGGVTEAKDHFSPLIKRQVTYFLQSVDLVLFVVDYKAGLCPEDQEVARLVQETGKKTLLIVNKVDKVHELDTAGSEFYELGFDLASCSIEHRHGLDQVLEWLHKNISEKEQRVLGQGITMAIVGKPNAGKSSLGNYILGSHRLLVSEQAGTTVDAVDVVFERDNKQYTIIDTAGLRRSSRREEGVEFLSAFQSKKAILRADMVLLMIDALIGPTEQDAKILELALEAHKGVILVINKSDLGEKQIDDFRTTLANKIAEEFHFFNDIPFVFVSAKNGRGVNDLFNKIEEIYNKLHFDISTSELNDFFFEVIRKAPSPVFGTKNVKFYYLTQTKQVPPSFIAFANHPDGVDNSYRRFLIKNIKDRWDLWGVPIRIFVMKSRS